MIRPLLIVLVVAGSLLLFLWWFLRTPPEQIARALRRTVVALIAVIIVALAVSGRLHWIFAFFGALLPFFRQLLRLVQVIPLPLLQRLFGTIGAARSAAGTSASGRTSRVTTRHLSMELDHDSGRMDGVVLDGEFGGRRLSDLTMSELERLRAQCRADAQSSAVLEAYLDRMHPNWRESADVHAESPRDARPEGKMSEAQALEILGLKAGATREEIIAAHRRLIQKFHPDHGGSDYLAAEINRAKDRLLDGK